MSSNADKYIELMTAARDNTSRKTSEFFQYALDNPLDVAVLPFDVLGQILGMSASQISRTTSAKIGKPAVLRNLAKARVEADIASYIDTIRRQSEMIIKLEKQLPSDDNEDAPF